MPNIIPVTDLSAPELELFARTSEVQLLHYYEPQPGVFIAESPKVIKRALDSGYLPIAALIETSQLAQKETSELLPLLDTIPIYTADLPILADLTGFPMTRGMICAMRRRELPSIETICADAHRIAVLENVVNPTNIGAIFRSAAALHMDAILLTHGCCDPLYRRAIRVSMGTVFQIPWTIMDNSCLWPDEGLSKLTGLGFRTAAMALQKNSISIDDPRLKCAEKLAVILGTEGNGLSCKTISKSDYTVLIPMSHGVDSLNVAAASAVAFWELGKKGS